MKMGMIGLGKLGMPVAVSMALMGHKVKGYDINPDNMSLAPVDRLEKGPDNESDFNEFLIDSDLEFGTLSEVVNESDIVFVSVQTPHHELFGGTEMLLDVSQDFDYTYLKQAVKNIAEVMNTGPKPIVIISTVLPETMRREILPLCTSNMQMCYNPYFIAMGTVMHDFFNPEFVLLGCNDPDVSKFVTNFYIDTIGRQYSRYLGMPSDESIMPIVRQVSIESAELTKVAYNTFIGQKITFANTLMEISYKIDGCDVNEVTDSLKLACGRLISPAYMTAGMGDGGGCHPRDNIAMSHLADRLGLCSDVFSSLMVTRERQAKWLCELVVNYARSRNTDYEKQLPVVILGYAYKPETNLTDGSTAILCKNIMKHNGNREPIMYDPYIDTNGFNFPRGVYLIGCKHSVFPRYTFPRGSIVIDPHRYIPDQEGVEVVRVGESKGKLKLVATDCTKRDASMVHDV